MGDDDANEVDPERGIQTDECLGHEWVMDDFQVVERNGVTGMSMVHRCKWCPATYYEPSNVDRWPETKGLDPRL